MIDFGKILGLFSRDLALKKDLSEIIKDDVQKNVSSFSSEVNNDGQFYITLFNNPLDFIVENTNLTEQQFYAKYPSARRNLWEEWFSRKYSEEQLKDLLATESDEVKAFNEVGVEIINNIKELVNIGGSIIKDKLKITDDQKGIFDFSLASLGLYRPVEYFSQDWKDDVENKNIENIFENIGEPLGIIPPLKVRFDNELRLFYFEFKGKKYSCKRRQKGTTKVFDTFPNECVLKNNKQGIQITFDLNNQNKVFNGRGDAKLKYASSNKKSYLMFERKKDFAKYVDIQAPFNYLGSPVSFFNIMAYVILMFILEEYGIKTRFYCIRGGGDSDSNGNRFASVLLKDYGEQAKDKVKSIINLYTNETLRNDIVPIFLNFTNGSGVQNGTFSSDDSRIVFPYYDEKYPMSIFFQKYKNWQDDEGNYDGKATNRDFQILEALDKTMRGEANQINAYLNNMPKLVYMVYRMIDKLAFELNTIEEMKKIIEVRFNEDKNIKQFFNIPPIGKEREQMIEDYLTSIMYQKYRANNEGRFVDTQKQSEEKKQKLDNKVAQLKQTFINENKS